MAGSDFVDVQLTEAGVAFAGGSTLRINVGRRAFAFEPGAPLRVERSYEWGGVLSRQFTPVGEPTFELAPAAPASKSSPEPAQETH